MTVQSEVSKDYGYGDGYVNSFYFYFKYFTADEIRISVGGVPVDILETTITRNPDGDGGTITLATAPASGVEVIIYREIEFTQETKVPVNDKLGRETIEVALDKLTMLSQQINEQLQRTITMPIELASGVSVTLEAPMPGKSLIWNEDGDALINSEASVDEVLNLAQQSAEAAEASAENAAVAEGLAIDAANAAIAAQEAAENASGTFIPASVDEILAGVNVSKQGTPNAIAGLWELGPDIASASIIEIPDAGGGAFYVTGTTNITEITATVLKSGRKVTLIMEDELSFIHDNTKLILPDGQNITTNPNDVLEFLCIDGVNGYFILTNYTNAGAAATASNLLRKGEFRGRPPLVTGNSTIEIQAGWGCRDDSDTYDILFPTDTTIDLDGGTGELKLDTGSPAISTKYHLWVGLNTSTGDVTAVMSASATAPTMPGGYGAKRKHPGSWYNDSSGNLVYQEFEGEYPYLWVTYPEQVSDAYGYEATTDPMMVLKRGTQTTATAVSLASRIADSDLVDVLAGSGIYSVSGVSYIYQKGTTIVRARLNLSGAGSYNCNDQFEGPVRTNGSGEIGYKVGSTSAPMSITIKGYKCNLYTNGL